MESPSLRTGAAPLGLRARFSMLTIGGMPIAMFAALALVTILAAATGKLPNDMIGGFAVLMLSGLLLGEIGSRIPVFRHIGGPAILCLFVPSALLGYKLMDDAALKAITTTMKTANLQYLYIACLVAGSILGMNRKILIQGFLKMFVPLLVGTVTAIAAGVLVGLMFGHDPKHTFFYIVMPILGGGIGEGILPLSIGYAEITGHGARPSDCDDGAGRAHRQCRRDSRERLLKRFGEKHRAYSGDGMLVKSGDDQALLKEQKAEAALDLRLMGFGLLLGCTLFILGMLLAPVTGIPGPVLMIVAAAVLKLARAIPESHGNRRVSDLQVHVDEPHLCDSRRTGHAVRVVGQARRRVLARVFRDLRIDRRGDDRVGLLRRRVAEDVSGRGGDHHRVPQRPRRHRRCRDPVLVEPHGTDALRADLDAHRRRGHGRVRHADDEVVRLMRPRSSRQNRSIMPICTPRTGAPG